MAEGLCLLLRRFLAVLALQAAETCLRARTDHTPGFLNVTADLCASVHFRRSSLAASLFERRAFPTRVAFWLRFISGGVGRCPRFCTCTVLL